ncbi:MAG: AMP-binding protein [Gammaproteobacteria bacterium]|jgi:long-chain acyl-CoA synthetase|nr:AMP-binding protein [Gammaproteobacteria bacterium]MBT6331069.1 AMP-binding protein [Gammaproteobacteria bacterium]MBT7322524.1 AMP-binding protein [Gammaproteobacteria bacterium]
MEKIWLKHYPKNVPSIISKSKFNSIIDLMRNSSTLFPNNTAFTNLNTKLSYKKIDAYSEKFGAYLQTKLSITKGCTIAIMLPNLLTYPVALFGAYIAGATVVNINPLFKSREIENVLNDSRTDTIIILDRFISELKPIIKNTSIKNIIVCRVTDLLSPSMSIMVKIALFFRGPKINLDRNYLYFSSILSNSYPRANMILDNNDIALLQYTGGTTGKSKAAVLTHGNILSNVEQLGSWVGPIISSGKENIITALPLYHIFSFTVNLIYFYSIGSNNILVTNPRDLKSFLKTLKKYKFTVITGVNTLFNLLLTSSSFRKIDFSSLKFTVGGGMSVLKSTADKWKNVTGVNITQGYGLTETSPIVSVNIISDSFNGTIGLPMPSTDISIRDENGSEVDVEQKGELCVKGPQVMSKYWNNIEETTSSFTDDGFFKTGDISTINKDGFLRIVDRKKDMIITSGYNVYPNEIEEYVSQHPDVNECGVIGINDINRGESISLFIVKTRESLTKAEIINYCKKGLTVYKIPKKVIFINEIPKNNVGKILRRKLREL